MVAISVGRNSGMAANKGNVQRRHLLMGESDVITPPFPFYLPTGLHAHRVLLLVDVGACDVTGAPHCYWLAAAQPFAF